MYDLSGAHNNCRIRYAIYEGPLTYESTTGFAFRRKNSDQFDIYSFAGKMATVTVPIVSTQELNGEINILFSQNMLDIDDGWESIVNYSLFDNYVDTSFFKVYDDDKTELLADNGIVSYGFDGKNTYVLVGSHIRFSSSHIKAWQFRTNIQNSSSQNLAKKAASQSPIQIIGHSGGDYRVTLSPTNGNQIDFQMFDLMGRCVFARKINNLISPVTFTVHENIIPASPFITKVSDGENNYYKRQVPVR